MINTILYSYFDFHRVFFLAEEIVKKVDAHYANVPGLSTALQRTKDSLVSTKKAVGSSSREELTVLVREADRLRDLSYITLRDHIIAGTRRPGHEDYRNACLRLMRVFERHGFTLQRENYVKESVLLSALFDDLAKPQSVEDMVMIHAVEWLNELKQQEERFKELFYQRNDERIKTRKVISDQEAKGELREKLDNMLAVLNGLAIARLVPNVEEVVDQINQAIDRAVLNARQQDFGKPEADSEATPEVPTNPEAPPVQ